MSNDWMSWRPYSFIALCCLAFFTLSSWGEELNPALNEKIVMIPKQGAIVDFNLETTLYKPNGLGPFPVVVINHGKAAGDTRFQARARYGSAARFFLQRGYAVVVPMRQGFSKSGGSYIGAGCNVESNGRVQAEDVKAVLDYVKRQTWANTDQVLVMGQSHGGWTTLAFGALNYPGVRGLVNFAGGLRQTDCASWEGGLIRGAKSYGAETAQPSLWFYGDNDSYFSPYVFHRMHENYVMAGGKAELIAFGRFGTDAHAMFGSPAGEAIWQPAVEKFMRQIGLPVSVIFPEYASPPPMAIPAATGFADVTEIEKIPHLGETGREGYKNFLSKQLPKAFALSEAGGWGWAAGGEDPLQRALDYCNKRSKRECHLYAVDDKVVWVRP